jgi:rhodanese-related sulfurtransferase
VLSWVGAYTLLGYLFSRELDRALLYAMGTGKTILALAAGGLALYVLRKYALRRRFFRELFIARITPEELKQKLDAGEDIAIIEVRHSLDFEADPYTIPGAVRIPSEQLENNPEVPRDREVVVYCSCPSEASSARMAIRLRQRGVTRVRPLTGGFHAWKDRGYPVKLAGRRQSK